jgi:hypothetical protein
MDSAEFVKLCPRLYHMAEVGCWAAAQNQGLLSTSALLDLYEISGERRRVIESEIRTESVIIQHDDHGTAVIRDNKPLRRENLEKRLLGMSVAEWCEMLNRHVFFWPSEDHLHTLLNARAYCGYEHEVLTIDTARLLERHGEHVRLSPINSGNTIYPPKRRYGIDTFKPLDDYPYEERRKARGRRDAIVEVAVETGVPDVAELVVSVDRRKGDKIVRGIVGT